MKITSISHNLHSSSIEPVTYPLADRQIITGPNRCGKTAIIDAISLALAGYVPRLGKSGDKLEPVIGKAQKAVSIMALSDGSTRSFAIEKRPNGSIGKTASFDLKNALTPFTIDPGVFLAAKNADRVAMIQAAVSIPGDAIHAIMHRVRSDYPLAAKVMSKSTDPGEFATESDNALKASISACKEALDRQKQAMAASIEHDTMESVKYSESEHNTVKKTVRNLEGVVAANESMLQVWGVEVEKPEEPDCKEPTATLVSIQQSLTLAKSKKSDLNRAFKEAGEAITKLAALPKEGHRTCPTCGADETNWCYNNSIDAEVKSLKEAVAKLPSDDEFLEADITINELLDSLRAKEQWDNYRLHLDGYNARESRRVDEKAGASNLLEKAKQELATQKIKLAQLDASRDKWIAIKAREEQHDRMTEAQKNLETEIGQLAAARKYIAESIAELSNKMMKPVLEKAAKFTDGIMPPLKSANFRIGYVADEDQWVPLEAFCGSEMAIATAALQAALQTQGDLKSIIIDEAQRIDPDLLWMFSHNIDKAIEEGVIEQAIIVGSRLEDAAKSFNSKHTWSTTILS